MIHTLHYDKVKTRKEHRCFSCYRKFPIGTLLFRWSSVYDSQVNNGYTCETCHQIHAVTQRWDGFDGEGIPEQYVSECLNKGQTPEQYLIEYTEQYEEWKKQRQKQRETQLWRTHQQTV